ncbi:MAG: hypothetical protein U1E05_05335, partial [Patescibacteria group bacterium]|nr:hypothetical protein [Patescibacteria group bacterium]
MTNTQLLADMVELMAILRRKKTQRSLCELRCERYDDLNTRSPQAYKLVHDFDALREFIRHKLTRSDVRLRGWKAGAVVFYFAVEVARRKVVGSGLWETIADEFPVRLRDYLFPNNHPSSELKEWIGKTAQLLRLRHVFDEDERKPWYITTHLQFGFAQPGFQANLPEWLCGQNVPDAVHRLFFGDLRSKSFRDLWGALQSYRRDWIAEGQLRDIIRNSPWVLPEWEDDLVRLSREKLNLPDGDKYDTAAESKPSAIVQAPQLRWNGSDVPEFACEFADLTCLSLREPHYHVMAEDTLVATIFRQPDDTYRSDKSELRFPADNPQVNLNLVDAEGDLHPAHQLVTLWDDAAEVNAFDVRTGHCVDIHKVQMRPKNNYILILQSGLKLIPASEEWVLIGKATRFRVELLIAGWNPDETYVGDSAGACVWEPPVREGPAPSIEPACLRTVWNECDNRRRSIRLGDSIRPVIRDLPSDATLVYVRLAAKPLVFDAQSAEIASVLVTPEAARAGLMFTLGIRLPSDTRGRSIVRLQRRVEVEITGAAQRAAEGWQTLKADSAITAHACQRRDFSVFLPEDIGDQRAALME